MTIDSIFYGRVRTIHFIGIGGIGMSGIAEILLSLGLKVHGSDLSENENIKSLRKRGAKIHIGHEAKHVQNSDVVVISSAITTDNPEVVEAKKRQITIVSRAEMLAELMRLKYGIAISGSHGKTTTTSLVSTMLQHAKLDPTVVIGGKVNQMGSNAVLGKGSFLVAEADESDGSFMLLSPTISVITNIDPEHLDYWQGGIAQLKKEFTAFANKLPFFGLCVLCQDSKHVRAILPKINRRHTTYGIEQQADYMATDIKPVGMKTHFTVLHKGKKLGQIKLNLVGQHNVLNALAAIAVGEELGISFVDIAQTLTDFQGVQRRFTMIGKVNDITIIDDYGHHPTEIRAVLQAAQTTFPKQRIVVLFQPHRYSRTQHLFEDFKTAFGKAHEIIFTDIYSANEKPIKGISAESLTKACQANGSANFQYGGNMAEATDMLVNICSPDDIVITLGAGTVTQCSSKILELIKKRFKKAA